MEDPLGVAQKEMKQNALEWVTLGRNQIAEKEHAALEWVTSAWIA
jgi:hypothetical protein